MELTLNTINTYFNEANKSLFLPLFGMMLPTPIFKLSNTTRTLGCFVCSRLNKRNKDAYRIHISKKFKYMSKSDVMHVLVHEMVHEYIAWAGIKDNSMHGHRFCEAISRINVYNGNMFHLSVSNSTIKLKQSKREYTVVLANFENSKRYIILSKSDRLTNFIKDRYRIFGDVVVGRTSSNAYSGYRGVRNRVAGYQISSADEKKLIRTMSEIYRYSKIA